MEVTNLLSIKIFNWTFDWTMEEALFWLLVAQVVLILFLVLVFAILLHRVGRVRKKDRRVISLSLDTSMVKREFNKDDTFDCEGLLIDGIYNILPRYEHIDAYQVITNEEYLNTSKKEKKNTCYVIIPTLDEVGKKIVEVIYKDVSTRYVIEVKEEEIKEEVVNEEPIIEEVQPVEEKVEENNEVVEEVKEDKTIELKEESYEGGTLRYDKSFTARYIQSDEDQKELYITLKNELLSYKKVKARMSWKRETYRIGRNVVARLSYRGKTLCLYLALNPSNYTDSKYKVEDVSSQAAYVDTPCMYRLKNERRYKYALDLINEAMNNMNAEHIERDFEDYYLPYEGVVELINKGLIRRLIKTEADEAIFKTNSDNNDSEVKEENDTVQVLEKSTEEVKSQEEN